MNKVLVVGASGATGKLLVGQLLGRGLQVIAIVRGSSTLVGLFGDNPNYREISATIGDMPEQDLASVLANCDAVFSCLGHNLTMRGMYGKPRRLVTDAIRKITGAVSAMEAGKKTRIILMNTTGNSNRDIPEVPPLSQRIVVFVLRYLLPPHADNEQAADFLRTGIGQNHPHIEWAAVRPDGLVDEAEVSDYEIHTSPTRNAIFDSGKTSRINVANFMANLSTDAELWDAWKGKMPVIYNRT